MHLERWIILFCFVLSFWGVQSFTSQSDRSWFVNSSSSSVGISFWLGSLIVHYTSALPWGKRNHFQNSLRFWKIFAKSMCLNNHLVNLCKRGTKPTSKSINKSSQRLKGLQHKSRDWNWTVLSCGVILNLIALQWRINHISLCIIGLIAVELIWSRFY